MSKHLEISSADAGTLLNGMSWICDHAGAYQEVADLVSQIIGLYPEFGAEFGYILEKAGVRYTLTDAGRAALEGKK